MSGTSLVEAEETREKESCEENSVSLLRQQHIVSASSNVQSSRRSSGDQEQR